MENSLDDLELKHEMSTYSSFYKSQTSFHRDKSKATENAEENYESGTADKNTEKEDFITSETSIADHSNVSKKTESDMNNNSNDNKERLRNGISGSQYNKEGDDDSKEMKSTLHSAKDKSFNEEGEITKENQDKEKNVDRSKGNDFSGSKQQKVAEDKSSLHDERLEEIKDKPVETKDKHIEAENKHVDTGDKPVETDDKPIQTDDKPVQKEDKPVEAENKTVESSTITGDFGKDSGENRPKEGSPDPQKSQLINENPVNSRESSIATRGDDKDIGIKDTNIQNITKQVNGNDAASPQESQSVTEYKDGDHTTEAMDDKSQTPTEGNAEEKASVSENDQLKDQPLKNNERETNSDGNPLSSDKNEQVNIPLQHHDDDIYQMPYIESKNISETVSKGEKNHDEKHSEEIVTTYKKSNTSENVLLKDDERKTETKGSRSSMNGKEMPIVEAENIHGTKHPGESDKRDEEEKSDSGVTKLSSIRGDDVSAATHVDNSSTKNTVYSSENNSFKKEDIPKSKSSTYDNLYFTGRLPSLLYRDESLQSINNIRGGEEIAEETEQIVTTETSKMAEENEDDVRAHRQNIQSSMALDSNHIPDVSDNERVKSDVRNTPTPSRKIRELIEEMKEPSKSVDHRLNEVHHSSQSSSKASEGAYKYDMFTKAITEVQEANEPVRNEQNDNNSESANMTVEDINMVTSKVLGTTYVDDRHSKFDNLPHMKQIEDYVKGNLKTEHTPLTAELVDGEKSDTSDDNTIRKSPNEKEHKETDTDRFANENDVLSYRIKQSPQLSHQNKNGILDKTTDPNGDQKHQQETNGAQPKVVKPENGPVQTTSSEVDLKAIIESAKIAISTGTETTVSHSAFGTSDTSGLTLQGDNMSMVRKRTRSRATSKGVWSSSTQSGNQEALASLICSNCLQVNSNIHSAGYCTDCQKYLCNTCVAVHTVDNDTIFHEIVPSYCKNELAINKYIQATGYCADCSSFLCTKCVVQHTGFRANRHHRIIQSSFVSKPSDRQAETADEFLDQVQKKVDPNDSKTSERSKKEGKKKRKLLSDLDHSNPYSVPSSHVPESLYPGPNKKLSTSYTKDPKWVHSSIPNLPYLVQPKPVPDRVFHAAGRHRPLMIYTRPKTGLDAMAAKMKLLKSRYKIKDGTRTIRRREQAVFTARPAKGHDNLSLPDVGSRNSNISGRRSVKHTVEQHTSAVRKEVEFLNEHCLSIPFPRGEKRTDILAMTILMNGKMAVLDKNNNNIKLYNKTLHCVAALQFQNRLVDICASNLCPTDIYAATPKHLYEVSAQKGMDVTRQMKVEIKRIEGMVCWKYGLAVISKKTNITWEIRLLDYRGYLKSKLEIFNPFTLDIASSTLHHMTSSRGGKYVSLSDTKNSCIMTVDVTTRVVVHETMLEAGRNPTYVTSDGEGNHNLFVACDNKVFQISRKGKVLGVLIDKAKENGEIGCIIYNKHNDRMYVKTGKDMISVYQIYF